MASSFFLLQTKYFDGRVLWQGRELIYGDVVTPMSVHPADVRLGTWGSYYGGDFQFIRDTITLNPDRAVRWIPEVIACIRPDTSSSAVA